MSNIEATRDLPVLIIHTGNPDKVLRGSHGDYAEMLRHAAGLLPQEVQVIKVYHGETMRPASSYRAALITGSPAMVTDREPWSERTADWIREAAAFGLPMFGICYGHQLLAHALGGSVDYNPLGRELGTQIVECLPAAVGDPLMTGMPERFPAQLLHAQSVTQLPPGAVALARSDMDPHQLVRLAPFIYSAQFHPEFGCEFMRDHLERYAEDYKKEGLDIPALVQGLGPTPTAGNLVRRFLKVTSRSAARTA